MNSPDHIAHANLHVLCRQLAEHGEFIAGLTADAARSPTHERLDSLGAHIQGLAQLTRALGIAVIGEARHDANP